MSVARDASKHAQRTALATLTSHHHHPSTPTPTPTQPQTQWLSAQGSFRTT